MNEVSTTPVTGSAKPINHDETFYVSFEPKTCNRFICYMRKKDKTLLIPSYLIREITRPTAIRANNQWVWKPIQIKTYDPIVPSATQLFYEYIMENSNEKFDITIDVLGPVGDSVEKWKIKNAEIIEVDFGTLDWGRSFPDNIGEIHTHNVVRRYRGGEPAEVMAIIKYDVAELLY